MFTTPISRVLAISVLLAALFGSFVLSGANYPALHTSDAERESTSAIDADGEPALAVGPVDVGAIEPGLLRGDPADRHPWEGRYMYAVSVLAVLWVAVRLGGWQVNRRTLALEPGTRSPVASRSASIRVPRVRSEQRPRSQSARSSASASAVSEPDPRGERTR